MDLSRFLIGSILILALGVCTSWSCDPNDIQKCIQPMFNLIQSGDDNFKAICPVVKAAMACMDREIAMCPGTMQSTVDSARAAIAAVNKPCENPDENIAKNPSSTSCNREFQECMGDTSQEDPKLACLNMGTTRRCIDKFKKTCKDKMFIDIIKSQEKGVNDVAEMCEQNGYKTAEYDLTSMPSTNTSTTKRTSPRPPVKFQTTWAAIVMRRVLPTQTAKDASETSTNKNDNNGVRGHHQSSVLAFLLPAAILFVFQLFV